ncbi:MAG: sphingomyelin phosphodiesterase [Bacteroidetes bacterium]|nr:sphingomyelin phosphodiesterase [Bacteroidota bacterium]
MKYLILIFALIAILSGYAAGTTDTVSITPTPRQISILTYNIKMLPRAAISIGHHPVKRAKLIPAKMIEENPDVIVFQEGFDGLAIRILRRKLKEKYPYTAGFKNHIVFTFKKAGGVLMFSKYPIRELESIKYTQCKGIDCAARKGCLLAEVQHPIQKFQILGTHMQAGGSNELKISQYKEAGALLKKHAVAGIPQFAAGDFNTRKNSTDLYPSLVQCMEVEDGDITGELQATSDHLLNDMDSYRPDKRNLIDFVFYRSNGFKAGRVERCVRRFMQPWSKTHKDLSDHFAVLMKMEL